MCKNEKNVKICQNMSEYVKICLKRSKMSKNIYERVWHKASLLHGRIQPIQLQKISFHREQSETLDSGVQKGIYSDGYCQADGKCSIDTLGANSSSGLET